MGEGAAPMGCASSTAKELERKAGQVHDAYVERRTALETRAEALAESTLRKIGIDLDEEEATNSSPRLRPERPPEALLTAKRLG